MMQDSYVSLLKFILPTYILDYFELKSAQEKGKNLLNIELEESSVVSAEFGQGKYYSKGFYPKITLEDSPLRGHRVSFPIKRRRWMKMDGEEKYTLITRDCNLV